MKTIPFFKKNINDSDLLEICQVIKTGNMTYGQETKNLELKFISEYNFKNVFATNCATSAIHLALMALDLKSGDKIVIPTNTYSATAMACQYVGAEVIFCDIELNSFSLCSTALEEILKEHKIKAVIHVYLGGKIGEINSILKLKKKYGFHLIEDCAHAFYSKNEHKFIGTNSDMAIFSFHPNKVLGSIEGGLLVTNRDDLCRKIELLKNTGINREFQDTEFKIIPKWLYDIESIGYKYAMNNVCAKLVSLSLKYQEEEYLKRKDIAIAYSKELSLIPDIVIPDLNFSSHEENFHLYIIRSKKRNELSEFLEKSGIETSLHYRPLHLHSLWRDYPYGKKLDNSEIYYKEALSLPIYPDLEKEDLNYIISKIREFFS